ncbi:MAG: DNA replication/repair protein RecF [Candidatus Eremiobacteraeota bacterium]|nr:DNA replication/repair protein RecF [Candidatus Eremiobacteraeota bacterium]
MRIKSFSIKDFRNITRLELEPHEGITLFFGENAQGKSNILEALGLLSTGRSFRTMREAELIAWQSSCSRVEAEVSQGGLNSEVTFVLIREKDHSLRKKIVLNGAPLKKLSQYIGKVKNVIFSRHDLAIITGAPFSRRRFLDHMLCLINPSYLFSLQRYYSTLKERNHWLKSARPEKNPEMEGVWKEQLTRYGTPLLKERKELLEKFSLTLASLYHDLTGEKEKLTIGYSPSFGLQGSDESTIHRHFLAVMEKSRSLEKARRTTLYGPHRDDFNVMLENIPLRAFGSQGQQRYAAIALKLAESETIEGSTGDLPVLLMDDCFSELDEARARHLWRHLGTRGQVFLSSHFIPVPRTLQEGCTIYTVREGRITAYE